MLVGRKKELQTLNNIYKSTEAEFLVVYGRRRVGKTFLIRTFFENKKAYFVHATGIQKESLKTQLENFSKALSKTFFDGVPLKVPASWSDAFELLNNQIIKTNQKVVIFLDELPWLATPKSKLLESIDYYWNHHWSRMPNVVLIACGSSASWLIEKIVCNKGGLHNRLTKEIRLMPFTLPETKAFLRHKKIKLNNQHVLSLFMALGGVPYYLKYVEPHLTAAQNIQQIVFDKNAPLKDEFNKLFNSLFSYADAYIELVKLVAKKREGVKRAELEKLAKFSQGGGRLTSRLNDLVAAGFVEEYIPFGKVNGEYYKLIDEFSLFYLTWVCPQKNKRFTSNHWIAQSDKPTYKAWSGYAFESVCMKHVDQIVEVLNIKSGGVISSWRYTPKAGHENGAQIDLLIDRNDGAITLCEIKYTDKPFRLDKQCAKNLLNKAAVFQEKTKTKKQLFIALISASGIKESMYSEELISGVVTLNDLC